MVSSRLTSGISAQTKETTVLLPQYAALLEGARQTPGLRQSVAQRRLPVLINDHVKENIKDRNGRDQNDVRGRRFEIGGQFFLGYG